MVSQIERGRVNPSVSTLYEISTALEISLDELFTDAPGRSTADRGRRAVDDLRTGAGQRTAGARQPRDGHRARHVTSRAATGQPGAETLDGPSLPAHDVPVVHRGDRRAIELAHGVRWELLVPVPERSAEFMEVIYAPGGGSTATEHAIRHNGREYGVIIDGVLSVQLGFERYELGPGDSVVFDSTIPHRYWNEGRRAVRGIWFVLDRWQVSDPGWEGPLRPHP